MASSQDGKLIFIAFKDYISVYSSANFSSHNPPDPDSIFPFNPLRILRASQEQVNKIRLRCSGNTGEFVFNHVRSGWIGNLQESLVAVGEFGVILVWNIGNLDEVPVLLEGSLDFESTWGIAISSNNFLIATSSNSHQVTLFHFPSKRVIYSGECEEEKIHKHNIPSLDFSPCGRWLVSCSIEGTVGLWSLMGRVVTRFNLEKAGSGWLVRFVQPSHYTNIGKTAFFPTKVSKRVYTSNIKDKIEEYPIEYDQLDYIDSASIESEEFDDNFEDWNDVDESRNSLDSNTNSFTVSLDANQILSQILISNEEGVHLAEGAGDTWPTHYEDDDGLNREEMYDLWEFTDNEDEDEDEDEYEYEHEHEDQDQDQFKDEDQDQFEDEDDNEETESNEFKSSYETCFDVHDSENYGRIHSKTFNFSFINNEGISLFPHKSESTSECPYHIFYFTKDSFIVIDPSIPWQKIARFDFTETCMSLQNLPKRINYLVLMERLLRRLSMGEWISDLGVFLIVDYSGYLIVIDPKMDYSKCLYFDSVLVPEILEGRNEIIGYSVIRRIDAEYGVKLHVYLICADGTFRLFEIVKTALLFICNK